MRQCSTSLAFLLLRAETALLLRLSRSLLGEEAGGITGEGKVQLVAFCLFEVRQDPVPVAVPQPACTARECSPWIAMPRSAVCR